MTGSAVVAAARLQRRLQARVDALSKRAVDTLVRHIGTVVRNNPSRTAEAVLYRSDVLRVLDEQLHELHRHTADLATAGYQAGMRLARNTSRVQINELGLLAPSIELWPSPYLDAVLADLDRAADRVKTTVLWLAGEAYRNVRTPVADQDGGVPNVPAELGRLRAVAVASAITYALNSWGRTARAAVAVLLTRGQNEITVDTFAAVEQAHSTLRLAKQWQTTSANPCATCRRLNGTTVPLGRQFDHTAEGSTPPVFRDLFLPPRHPHCSCRIVVVVLPAASPVAA